MQEKGLSLLEIIVSAVIMSLLITGLANLFLAGKRQILHSRARMTGGELGKYFLDPLQMDVRQDQWGSNCLSAGINCPGSQLIEGLTYAPVYVINHDSPIAKVNKVRVDITWNEPSP